MITTTYKRLLLLAALPALMLASCSREEMDGGQGDSPDTQSGAIRFEIGFAPMDGASQTAPHTRVATDTQFNSTWENGDEIGIYAVKHGEQLTASGNSIHNVKLTYDGSTWTAAEKLYWPADGTKLDFYAYHPYDPTANNPTSMEFSVYTDQSATTNEKSNYNHSDLLTAKTTKADGYGKGETVKLSFTHALAMVQVNVSKSMIGNYPADMLKVELNGCSTDCKLNLFTQSATLPANPAPPVKIKMYPCPNDGGAPGIYAYRALVPAQEIAMGTVLFSFGYDGGTLLRSKPLAEPLSLVQSKAEKFDMTFPFTSATVSANVRLAALFSDADLAAITSLRVFGEMTPEDFYFIRDKMSSLTRLDLSQATVVGNAIPYRALYNTPNLKEFVFPSGITAIDEEAFWYCTGLTGSLTIPTSVNWIDSRAFQGCTGFTGSLTLPASLQMINSSAFEGCTGFTGLTLTARLVSIYSNTFEGCTGFTGSLILPANLKTIATNAFKGCSGFNDLTIPAGVEVIEYSAFERCTGLTSIICHIEDPTSGFYDSNAFSGVPKSIPLHVPAGTKDSYINEPWRDFTDIRIIQ